MKYPCEGCLVNATCIKSCDKLVFFLDSLVGVCSEKYIPPEWIGNKNKMERLLSCRNVVLPTTKLFYKLVSAYEVLHKKTLWDTFFRKENDE